VICDGHIFLMSQSDMTSQTECGVCFAQRDMVAYKVERIFFHAEHKEDRNGNAEHDCAPALSNRYTLTSLSE